MNKGSIRRQAVADSRPRVEVEGSITDLPKPVTFGHKLYFAAVGLLALWVGIWGYFIPERVDNAIPWLVPPLHARFLGAMYLSGAAFMLAGIFSQRYAEVRIMVRAIAIWTGMLLVVSLLHLDQFDYRLEPVWVWFAAYIVYPLIALWLMWQDRNQIESPLTPTLSQWVRLYFRLQGIGVTFLALCLLFLPNWMVEVWPWKISQLLAQLYSAPFLAYGLSSLMLSNRQTWLEVRVVTLGTGVFALGVLLASLIHRQLFSLNLAGLLWFGGFVLTTGMLGLLAFKATRKESLR